VLKSSSNGRSRFATSNRHGTVTVIEAPVARSYRRRAIIAFYVVGSVVALLSATVASHYLHPIVGAIVGMLLGAAFGVLVGAFIVIWPVVRVLWHWLPEIVTAGTAVYGWTWLMSTTSLPVSLLVVAVVVGVPAAVGPVRCRIVATAWCVIVRHRLRLCFAAFIATNRQGTLPLILAARPTPAGERVWVWLRPGLALTDLEAEGQTQKLAVACWANEVRVTREGRRFAALIRIDITRREPLTRRVNSPLPGMVPDHVPSAAPTSPGMPPVALDLPDVPEPATTPPTVREARRKPRNPHPVTPVEFDNSEYA
jgi:hypothetical protein